MRSSIWKIAVGGIMAAIIFAATIFIKFPLPTGVGYINFGDGCIFATAALLGPAAAIPAALGSALADLIGGAPSYLVPTLLIKGLMGLCSGLLVRPGRKTEVGVMIIVFLLCELIMVGGYFLAEWVLYGVSTALSNVPFNGIQALAGIIAGIALVPLVRRIPA